MFSISHSTSPEQPRTIGILGWAISGAATTNSSQPMFHTFTISTPTYRSGIDTRSVLYGPPSRKRWLSCAQPPERPDSSQKRIFRSTRVGSRPDSFLQAVHAMASSAELVSRWREPHRWIVAARDRRCRHQHGEVQGDSIAAQQLLRVTIVG